MAAEYLATLECLAADRETYLGVIPRDLIGLLRDLYPSSVSLAAATAEIDAAFQQRLSDTMAMLPNCSVRSEHIRNIHDDYVAKLTQVPYRREFLRREAAAKNKMRWWLQSPRGDWSYSILRPCRKISAQHLYERGRSR